MNNSLSDPLPLLPAPPLAPFLLPVLTPATLFILFLNTASLFLPPHLSPTSHPYCLCHGAFALVFSALIKFFILQTQFTCLTSSYFTHVTSEKLLVSQFKVPNFQTPKKPGMYCLLTLIFSSHLVIFKYNLFP